MALIFSSCTVQFNYCEYLSAQQEPMSTRSFPREQDALKQLFIFFNNVRKRFDRVAYCFSCLLCWTCSSLLLAAHHQSVLLSDKHEECFFVFYRGSVVYISAFKSACPPVTRRRHAPRNLIDFSFPPIFFLHCDDGAFSPTTKQQTDRLIAPSPPP